MNKYEIKYERFFALKGYSTIETTIIEAESEYLAVRKFDETFNNNISKYQCSILNLTQIEDDAKETKKVTKEKKNIKH